MDGRQAEKGTEQDPQQQADFSGPHPLKRRLIAKLQHSVNPRVLCRALTNQRPKKDVIDPIIVQCCSPNVSFSLAFDRLTQHAPGYYNVDVELRDVDAPNNVTLQIEAAVEWYKRPSSAEAFDETLKSDWPAPEPPIKVTLGGEGHIASLPYHTLRALTVHLEVYVLENVCQPLSAVLAGLNAQRLENTLTDVELRVDGKVFPAHRAVLATNSPVFRSMFTSDLKEAREGVVQIEDASSTAFGLFLEFLYTANLDEWQGCEIELLELADRYLVASLEAVCEERLLSLPHLALSALRHVDKPVISSGLRTEAMRLVARNLDSLSKTQQWKDFQASSPVLADAIRVAQELFLSGVKP